MTTPRGNARVLVLLAVAGALAATFVVLARSGAKTAPDPAAQADPGLTVLYGVAARTQASFGSVRDAVAARLAREALVGAFGDDATLRRTTLVRGAGAPDPTVRWVALVGAPLYGKADEAWVDALFAAAAAKDEAVRTAAREALQALADAEPSGVAALQRARPVDPTLRAARIQALARSAPESMAEAWLLERLTAEHVPVRRAAAFGLARLPIRTPRAETVEALRKALGDEDGRVAGNAALALARLGTGAAPAVGELVGLVMRSQGKVRSAAMTALAAVGNGAVPALEAAIDPAHGDALLAVVWLLRKIGTPDALAVLRRGLEHEAPLVRGRCAVELGTTHADEVLDTLVALLEEEDAEVLIVALEGLGPMGAKAAPARKGLEALGTHADARVRQAARVLLDRLDREGP